PAGVSATYAPSLHDALPIWIVGEDERPRRPLRRGDDLRGTHRGRRGGGLERDHVRRFSVALAGHLSRLVLGGDEVLHVAVRHGTDRKGTRLNSSHGSKSYAV